MSTVSIIGAGHVGLVTAAGLAELGHDVVCVDIDASRVSALLRGALPIYEPGLGPLIRRNRRRGRLHFTDRYDAAIPRSDLVFIAVHTPADGSGAPDTSSVFVAIRSILKEARPGQTIVVKSTVPIGTCDRIAQFVERLAPYPLDVVANPEFLREGAAVRDVLAPDRIVVGATSAAAAGPVVRLYQGLEAPVVVCSRRSAELAKYVANAYLATRISFINEMSAICDTQSADIKDVARIVGLDHRIGTAYLRPGLGWGGSCFPKDVGALAELAMQHGCASSIVSAALEANERQRERVLRHLTDAISHIDQPVVAVLGLAFKPQTDDVRESPALAIVRRLLDLGIEVRAHDPVAMANARRTEPRIEYAADAVDAARGSDALLLATEWRQYLALDWRSMRAAMRGRTVVDGRNVLDGPHLASLGLKYVSIGRHSNNGSIGAGLPAPNAAAGA